MAAEIRVLGPTGIEDFHAHLLRLDRKSCLPCMDDQGIDAHCLDLIAKGAILIGAFVNGMMRAAAEIVPDRSARRAEASITVENGFEDRGLERDLATQVIDQARRYHLNNLRLHEHNAVRTFKIPVFELKAYA
jgi:hypothetical protein